MSGFSSLTYSFTPTMIRSRVSTSNWYRAEASAISFWKKPVSMAGMTPPNASTWSKYFRTSASISVVSFSTK